VNFACLLKKKKVQVQKANIAQVKLESDAKRWESEAKKKLPNILIFYKKNKYSN